MGIMDEVKGQIEKLDVNALRERLLKAETERKERQAKQKAKLATMSEEDKAKRNDRAKAYREKNADKFKASRTAYNKKPEVVAKRKAYMAKRNGELKLLRARAKELGILDDVTKTLSAQG